MSYRNTAANGPYNTQPTLTGGYLKEVAPSDPCDRCGHPSRRHAAPSDWSVCSVRQGTDDKGKPVYCPCDGYFPRPK